MLIFKGLSLAVLGGASVGPFPPEFQALSAGYLEDFIGPWVIMGQKLHATTLIIGLLGVAATAYFGMRSRRTRAQHGYETEAFALFVARTAIIAALTLFLIYSLATYKGLPNVLVVMGVLIGVFVFVTKKTTIGRRGNAKAAALSGIKTERLTLLVFANMGVLAALAGLIFAARLNNATPKAGQGFELDVIAAVFIGGASAMGGVGQVAGSVVGGFIMGVMNNGMSIMGINIDWQQMIKGAVLLAAVVFDVYNKNKG
jgi:putative multiple sugar transport system permease protein